MSKYGSGFGNNPIQQINTTTMTTTLLQAA